MATHRYLSVLALVFMVVPNASMAAESECLTINFKYRHWCKQLETKFIPQYENYIVQKCPAVDINVNWDSFVASEAEEAELQRVTSAMDDMRYGLWEFCHPSIGGRDTVGRKIKTIEIIIDRGVDKNRLNLDGTTLTATYKTLKSGGITGSNVKLWLIDNL